MNIRIKKLSSASDRLSCEEAKQKDMVDYLATLGFNPAKIKGNDYWYLSPLREENTASFKINRKLNVWFDHGTGKGGTIVDFGILYHNCTVKELLEKLGGTLSSHRPAIKTIVPEASPIQVISERPLSSLPLLRYVRERRISDAVAKKYCGEVTFSLHDKTHSAISFKNNKGGFELRNQWFKGSSSPKAITTFENSSKKLAVFEGFFDFLSYQSIQQNQNSSEVNFLVLNSNSFFEKSRQYMEGHDHILLFLDKDKTGQKYTEMALAWNKKYRDQSHLYKGYNDLNEWMQQIGKSMKKGLSL